MCVQKRLVVLACALTSDLKRLSLVCEVTTTKSEFNEKITVLLTFTTSILYDRSSEISLLASYSFDLSRLMNQMEVVLSKMESEWHEAKSEWNSKFELLHKKIVGTLFTSFICERLNDELTKSDE
jgi:hypothetical protein